MPDCLIVVGMHRSGTSALAGALHRLGVDFGANLVAAQHDNVRGYYEHRRILALHDRLLTACGSSWDDPAPRDWEAAAGRDRAELFRGELRSILEEEFGTSELWGVKDPRLSRLLPLWLPVLEAVGATPHVLVASRAVVEIASSLARRNGFSREKSARLWSLHVLEAERASRHLPRAFVDFEGLLGDPTAALTRAGRQLGVRWPREPAAAGAALAEFLDSGLRHQSPRDAGAEEGWGRLAGVVPLLVAALAGAAGDPGATGPFDRAARELAEVVAGVDPVMLEHLHQFARREAEREMWARGGSLQDQLAAASERLGGGLEAIERDLGSLVERLALLERELARQAGERGERTAEVDRTLGHLTAALAATEGGIRHLRTSEADLRAKVVRWEVEVGIEEKLVTIEQKLGVAEAALDHLARRADAARDRAGALFGHAEHVESGLASLEARISALEGRRPWLRRIASRLRGLLRRGAAADSSPS
ncbi:MAG: hypothetical protein OES32_00930 [Acidobacteriota bacterium]|nr:hypothetical protein [Acidobacteriota bacterium]MDH3522124.1 hypothetical protein [Acidobacteriota bacterium]